MQHYSQKQEPWQSDKLGTCNTTIRFNGCFIVSLSMLTNSVDPRQVNELLKQDGGYSQGCMVNSSKAASILGLQYGGRTNIKPKFICIAETQDYDRPSTAYKEQHFFVFAPKGTVEEKYDVILDPLDNPCVWKKNPYHIVSYRLFHINEEIDEEMEAAIKWATDCGIATIFNNKAATKEEVAVMLYRYNKLKS